MNPRQAAVTALLRIQEQGGYSNIVLEELLEQTKVSPADRALTARLLYGVTERRLTLDFLLNRCSDTPVIKMQAPVRELLRVGTYQLVFTDIPSFAAINESVELARRLGFARLTGYVNGVLRRVAAEAGDLLATLPTTDKGLELRYSCPRQWIRHWRDAYGEDVVQGMLPQLNDAPPSYIRVNTSLTTPAAFLTVLEQAGISAKPVEGLPAALLVESPGGLRTLPEEFQNHYYFQDLASQWCCQALGAQPGERVADVCAAPGGKTMTVAQTMENSGLVLAGDIYPNKCDTIRRRAQRYGLTCIEAVQRDASTPPPAEWLGTFDRVLCDAPCSGLGVIRRKPEIRYKSVDEFADLPDLQLRILTQAAALVRPGGVLQYSTCTLRPEENEQVVAAFLEANSAFAPRLLPLDGLFAATGEKPSHMLTMFPHIHGTDGFFVAGFQKR